MSNYIPDLTERFPEGFGGVDMTDSYFPSRHFRESDLWEMDNRNDEEILHEIEPKLFEVEQRYRVVGIYGGVTTYKVEEVNREENKILMSEVWEDVDGTGTRPSQWHKLEKMDDGNERALEWTSDKYGDFWINAY